MPSFNNISIIVSKTDAAGMNISKALISDFGFTKTNKQFDSNPVYGQGNFFLYFINEVQIFADYIDSLETDLFIFASKHSSKEQIPCLTVHAIGNQGSADFGGKPHELVPTSAIAIKELFLELNRQAQKNNLSFPVCLETVHHGPFLSKPAVFVEVGSTPKEWSNMVACKAVAATIMNADLSGEKKDYSIAIGFGDSHYCSAFTKVELSTKVALGHIVPRRAFSELSLDLFKQAVEKTIETPEFALLDWKSINLNYKEKILSYCNELSIPYKRIKEVLSKTKQENQVM